MEHLALEGRMSGIDAGIEHGPANSVGIDIEHTGSRIGLDCHARTPDAGVGGAVHTDPPDQAPAFPRIGQLREQAGESRRLALYIGCFARAGPGGYPGRAGR